MSFDSVPGPDSLLNEKRDIVEDLLGCETTAAAATLYKWADEILEQLDERGIENPKLELAVALGIPTDPRWGSRPPTERSTPRHRVIARFAREGLWREIWSLNWDCSQENALENVGIRRNGPDELLPWPTGFRVFVTAAQCGQLAEPGFVFVIKPHGCVSALIDALQARKDGDLELARQLSERFIIGERELNSLAPGVGDPTQNFVFARLHVNLAEAPLLIAGWSLSEPYLMDYIEREIRPILEARDDLAVDELSVIDLNFNNNHVRLADCYGRSEEQAHIPVNVATFTTDKLFLWMQSVYALDCLRRFADDSERAAVEGLLAVIEADSESESFVNVWADDFLSEWVALCWRSGLVEGRKRDAQPITSEDILMEARDEHIPWSFRMVDRPDLRSAALLLSWLIQAQNVDAWDFRAFPGGLFHIQDKKLVIPVPAWDTDKLNNLRGLKTLVDAMRSTGPGKIANLAILPIPSQIDVAVAPETEARLKGIVAHLFSTTQFAQTRNIAVFQPNEL